MKLSFISRQRDFYRVKRGQTLVTVAEAFGVPPRLLAEQNGLTGELYAGQVIQVPAAGRNLYRVRGGESKTLLCGSPENFRDRNGTDCFYPGQTVFL